MYDMISDVENDLLCLVGRIGEILACVKDDFRCVINANISFVENS